LPEFVSEISSGDVESKTQGANETARFLRRSPRPDGLFCFSDPMAIGAMDTALEAGISIPKQLAIVGCGNLHYDASLRIPLSSVDQKSEKIGEQAAKIILRTVLRDKGAEDGTSEKEIEKIILRPQLVTRQSTAR
jgi:LacI family transcriptional regulator